MKIRLVIRSSIGGKSTRQAIWSVDPDLSIPAETSLGEMVDESVATERFQTVILSSFGGAALLLAVLGIYGVLAYSVSLRTQEFGIRMALGSSKQALTRLVLRDAFWPMAVGLVLGLLGVAVVTRWVRSLLYETSAVDPWAIGLSTSGATELLGSVGRSCVDRVASTGKRGDVDRSNAGSAGRVTADFSVNYPFARCVPRSSHVGRQKSQLRRTFQSGRTSECAAFPETYGRRR